MIRVRKRVFYLKKEFRDQATNFLAARYDLLLVPATGDKGDDSQFTCDRDVVGGSERRTLELTPTMAVWRNSAPFGSFAGPRTSKIQRSHPRSSSATLGRRMYVCVHA